MSRLTKYIPLTTAVALYKSKLAEHSCSAEEKSIINKIITSVSTVQKGGKIYLQLDQLKIMLENFSLAVEEKDSDLLQQQRGLKVNKIVCIEEFVKSKEFMGQKRDVRPIIMKSLNEFWDPAKYYIVGMIGGGIGVGKNYFAFICMAYMIYHLNCYYNPQLEFDFAPGSGIVLIFQSKNEKLAKKVMFDQFAEMLKSSKYFQDHCNYDPRIRSELRFPNNVSLLPIGGSDTAALGMNVYSAVLDELNFMERVKDSVHTKYTGEAEYDQAKRLSTMIERRIKSRFMTKGQIPGKVIYITSKNYDGDFTDYQKKEAKKQFKETGRSDIYIMECAQWDAIPPDKFSGEKFLVEIGDDTKRSRIVRWRSAARDGAKVIEVPVEYRTDFMRDIEGALKDLGGLSVGTKSPFIPYRELITKAMTKHQEEFNNKSLFRYEKIKLSVGNPEITEFEEFDEVVDLEYIEECLLSVQQPFTVHIDVGLNKEKGDACGLAVSHIFGYTKLPEYKYYDPKSGEFKEVREMNVPIYCVDGALQILAQMGDEVDLNLVKDLVLYIKQKVNLKWGTMDTYQSRMMIQAFRRAKMRSGVLSVDTAIAPYTELKLAIKDERILLPYSEILHKEIRTVEKVVGKDRVDHPEGLSKDVSDGVAGSIYILQLKEAQYWGNRRSRKSVGHNYQKVQVLGKKEDKKQRMGTIA